MPFTLSHAAAALPFRRTRLVFSAVVAGCFAPDFEYFVRLGPFGKFGHSLPGAFFFDLPLALLMLGLFERYAKEPLRAWLPEGVQQRFPPDSRPLKGGGLGWWARVVASILVGIATHIVWDSFTHATYWPYRHLSLLGTTVTLPIAGPVPCYEILQHASSVLGLVVLWIWVMRQPRIAAPERSPELRDAQRRDRAVLALLGGIAVAAGAVRAAVILSTRWVRHDLPLMMAVVVVAAMTVFWVEVVVYGAVRKRRKALAPSEQRA